MRRLLAPHNLLKLALPFALGLGTAAGVMAQDATEQPMMPDPDYVVVAGGNGPVNTDYLTFFPNNLRVHRGDTVSWVIAGFHNIHFQQAPIPFAIPQEVNGQQMLIVNPEVPFPNVANGGAFTGGDTNSGIPAAPGAVPPFTLVIDAEVGTYNYFCDIHTGMSGSITVVPDDQETPTQVEVDFQVGAEIGAAYSQALEAYFSALMSAENSGDEAEVYAGAGVAGSVNQFLPNTVVVGAGATITWELNADSRELHTITWPEMPPGQDIMPIEQEGGPPILALGAVFQPTHESGADISQGEAFNMVVTPGQSVSLKIVDPGVYPYLCSLHVGMRGTIVVVPEDAWTSMMPAT